MDQPNIEVQKLETVLGAYARWEDLESKKSTARDRSRDRGRTTHVRQTET